MEDENVIKHLGGCHCGAVKFEVWTKKDIEVFDCNCSICTKKQNLHFIVPNSRFKLLQGEDNLSTYTFGTHQAKHTFCKTCGVQSFYTPRSNPNGKGVMPHCLEAKTFNRVTVLKFDGDKWEDSIAANAHGILERSNDPDHT